MGYIRSTKVQDNIERTKVWGTYVLQKCWTIWKVSSQLGGESRVGTCLVVLYASMWASNYDFPTIVCTLQWHRINHQSGTECLQGKLCPPKELFLAPLFLKAFLKVLGLSLLQAWPCFAASLASLCCKLGFSLLQAWPCFAASLASLCCKFGLSLLQAWPLFAVSLASLCCKLGLALLQAWPLFAASLASLCCKLGLSLL